MLLQNGKKQTIAAYLIWRQERAKTYTGLGAVAELSAELDGHLAVFIVAPFQHLVEQWVEDIVRFGIEPIIGYSSSKQKDWKKRLENAVRGPKAESAWQRVFLFRQHQRDIFIENMFSHKLKSCVVMLCWS